MAKGHSSFNVEMFEDFSPRTGSLEHAPVSGKLVASSLSGLHCCVPVASEVSNQAIFLEECRRDPEFRNRALGLERMLRVKAQNETNIRDLDNGVVSEPVRSSELVVGAASVEAFGVTSEFAVGAASAEASGVASVLVGGAASAEASERAATAGESQRVIGLRERYESDFSSLNSSGCLSVDARARALALPAASASLSSFCFSFCVSCCCCTCALHTHAWCTQFVVGHGQVTGSQKEEGYRQAVLVPSCLCRGPPVTA